MKGRRRRVNTQAGPTGSWLLAEEAFSDVLPEAQEVVELAQASSWLRREREFAFDGDVDVVPTEAYGRAEADRAIAAARLAVELARRVVPEPAP